MAYLLLLVSTVVITLIWQAHQIEKQMREMEPASEVIPEIRQEARLAHSLVPSRPEDYGMVVTRQFDRPRTTLEWEEFLHKRLSELKFKISPEVADKVRREIKEDPQETKEKMVKIDQGIQECREVIQREPDNKQAQEELQRLTMLKALTGELKNF